MEKSEVIAKLTEIFRTVFNDKSLILKDELTANDIDSWDSLSHFLLITKIEQAFEIKFQLKELNNTRNIGDILNLILSKL